MFKVLIIDNNVNTAWTIATVLKDIYGCVTMVENTEKNSLHTIAKWAPDLVITEGFTVNGMWLCRALKNISHITYTPIIVMGHLTKKEREEEVRQYFLSHGAIGYIPKPFNVGVFLETVVQLILSSKEKTINVNGQRKIKNQGFSPLLGE